MRLAHVLAALAMSAAPAQADEWTRTDTAVEAVVLTALAVDYIQTKRILADGREGNMLLANEHISPDAYFLTLSAAHVLAMRILPSKWRHIAQGVTIGAQSRSIARNWQAGYTVSF